jgi:exonuclease SbcD
MKLLHTSDWHLGRTLSQEQLLVDQEQLLDQVFTALQELDVDALVIAGDVFDRAVPSKEAVQLFGDFLKRVYQDTKCAIIAIAGNHDAPERVGFAAALQDPRRVLIRGPITDCPKPLILEDVNGRVAISALPFCEVFAARSGLGVDTIASPADVIEAQVARARAHVREGDRWVIVAHAFVDGGATTESERPLAQVGGIETVHHTVFSGAHYVALGHLHRAQHVGAPHIRYSGSWMGFNFDEAEHQKSMTLVDLAGCGAVTTKEVKLSCPRPLRVLTGKLHEIIALAATMDEQARRCLIKAVLTDEGGLIDPMGQLRSAFPHVLQLQRQQRTGLGDAQKGGPKVSRSDPMAMVTAFLTHVRDEGPSDSEKDVITAMLVEHT